MLALQNGAHGPAQGQARVIDILFREGGHVRVGQVPWPAARRAGQGEQGDHLSGRARAMPRVCWWDVVRAAGRVSVPGPLSGEKGEQDEFWVQDYLREHRMGNLLIGERIRSSSLGNT